MLESVILGAFALSLLACVAAGRSILYALVFGLALFFAYGLYKKHAPAQLLHMALTGVKTVKGILVTFLLIGMITAVWRISGVIPYIVYHATAVCGPRTMVLLTFLLCCLVSSLTGTAFGTAATMGVVCATMANGMGVPIVLTGGAVLAGSFFGDRCSPMSTSALLVSTLTHTSVFSNIGDMVKTSLVPFAVTCALYAFAGASLSGGTGGGAIRAVFADSFALHPLMLVPAAVIVLLCLLRANVKIAMSVSILAGLIVAYTVQKAAPRELLSALLFGFHPENPALARLLAGGGVLSMVNVFAIVCISSCYAGLFHGTGFLDGAKAALTRASRRITPFGGVLLTSLITGMISCNQTLTIMLTHEICLDVEKEPRRMASDLENTAVVISPLLPWSIAGAVPLASVGAPALCTLTGCYLYLVPLWNLLTSLRRRK